MWCREGWWQEGKLLNGRDGQVIHDPQAKLVKPNTPKNDSEAARKALDKLWASMPDFLTGTRHRRQKEAA